MTITPQQAQALLEGTTPGPWDTTTHLQSENHASEIGPISVDPDAEEMYSSNPGDLNLAAAAPVMAEQIAGMRPEYRAEFQTADGRWFPTPHRCSCSSGWGTKQQAARHAADWKADGYAARIVRRLVGEPEAID